MKVLQLNTHCNVGGIGNYILTLSAKLKEKGVSVVVATGGGDHLPAFARADIPHHVVPLLTKCEFHPRVIAAGSALGRYAVYEGIDLIHAHSRVSQVAGALAAFRAGIPLVTTCHGYFKKRLRGLIDTWGDRVVAISDAVRRHLIDDLDVSEERVRRIYSGVDAARFGRVVGADERESLRGSLGLDGRPIIGTIGRLSAVKGQRYLIDALARLIRDGVPAQGLMIGDGEEEGPLRERCRSLGIVDSVRFLRSVSDTTPYLALMDVFVFPSVKEGLGLGILEALAAARPCVASRIGGIGDIVTDGATGILVEVGDVAAIAAAAKRLLSDPALAGRMGEAGKRLVIERFSLDRMADEMLTLYREAVAVRGEKRKRR